MESKTSEESQESNPDAQLAAAKKAFSEAVAKTKEQEGEVAAPKAEQAEATPRKAKPKPQAPKADPELVAIKAEVERLKGELLRAKPAEKPEPESGDFDDVKERLSEQFGQEEGEVIASALQTLLEPRERRLAQIESIISKAIEQGRAHTSKSNRERLSGPYAQLKNDAAWEMIHERVMAATSKAQSKYESLDAAYDETVKALYGEPAEADLPDDETEEEASRIAASLPTQPSAKGREKPMSPEQKSRAIFDHLWKNPEDVSGAQRLARQLKVDR